MTITTHTAGPVRTSVYTAFLYGHGGPSPGEDWGIDLGSPVRYTTHASVYSQQFERGITMANIGDTPIRVELDGPYRDLEGLLRTDIELPPHGAEVLIRALQPDGTLRPQDFPPSPQVEKRSPPPARVEVVVAAVNGVCKDSGAPGSRRQAAHRAGTCDRSLHGARSGR